MRPRPATCRSCELAPLAWAYAGRTERTLQEMQSAAPDTASASKFPSEFRYWDKIDAPALRVLRALSRALFGFDPAPEAHKVEEFAASYYDADPLAEDFVREVVEVRGYGPARSMLDQALSEGVKSVQDAPPALLSLFADLEQDPSWVDWETIELGAKVFRRYGSAVFKFAGAITLQAYFENSVAKALILAGGYEGETTRKRFMATASFWIDVSEPGALAPGQVGRNSAMRVRIMHVFVRRKLQEHPDWNLEAWGVPISQGDSVLTLMGGSVAPGLVMQAMGYRPSRREIAAMLMFWRYVGHMMGVRPRWYPESIGEALQLLFVSVVKGAKNAGDDGVRLCQSYVAAFAPKESDAGGAVDRLREQIEYRKHLGYTRFFLPPRSYRANHLPSAGIWRFHPLAQFPFIFAAETLRRNIPGLDFVADAVARRQRKRWFARTRGGHSATFVPPDELAGRLRSQTGSH